MLPIGDSNPGRKKKTIEIHKLCSKIPGFQFMILFTWRIRNRDRSLMRYQWANTSPTKYIQPILNVYSRLCLAYVSREVGWLDEEGVGGQYRGQPGQQPQQQMPHQQLSHKQLPAMTGHGSQHRWDYRLSCGLKLFIKLYIYSYYYLYEWAEEYL